MEKILNTIIYLLRIIIIQYGKIIQGFSMLESGVLNYFSKKTLLIAEDHTSTRELLRSTLKSFFKKIITATNGIECIEKIRAINCNLPIIVISAFSDEQYLLKAANLYIQGYLLKPLDLEALESALGKIARREFKDAKFDITPDMTYDYINSTVCYKSTEIPLTNKENEFLHLLVKSKGSLIPYHQIEYEIWEKNAQIMSINSLRTLVKKLRSKLPVDIIKNVSKTGYKFSLN